MAKDTTKIDKRSKAYRESLKIKKPAPVTHKLEETMDEIDLAAPSEAKICGNLDASREERILAIQLALKSAEAHINHIPFEENVMRIYAYIMNGTFQ